MQPAPPPPRPSLCHLLFRDLSSSCTHLLFWLFCAPTDTAITNTHYWSASPLYSAMAVAPQPPYYLARFVSAGLVARCLGRAVNAKSGCAARFFHTACSIVRSVGSYSERFPTDSPTAHRLQLTADVPNRRSPACLVTVPAS